MTSDEWFEYRKCFLEPQSLRLLELIIQIMTRPQLPLGMMKGVLKNLNTKIILVCEESRRILERPKRLLDSGLYDGDSVNPQQGELDQS